MNNQNLIHNKSQSNAGSPTQFKKYKMNYCINHNERYLYQTCFKKITTFLLDRAIPDPSLTLHSIEDMFLFVVLRTSSDEL